MSKETRVLQWLNNHPEVKEKIVQSACTHDFETLKTRKAYRPTNDYMTFFQGASSYEVQIMVCKKCGKRVE